MIYFPKLHENICTVGLIYNVNPLHSQVGTLPEMQANINNIDNISPPSGFEVLLQHSMRYFHTPRHQADVCGPSASCITPTILNV